MRAREIVTAPPMADVRRLLDAAALPGADIDDDMLAYFIAVRLEGEMAGIAGLEPHGRVGLLRSLVVRDSIRGAGLGRQLVAEAEHRAVAQGIDTLYLLTNTAADYFRRLGYHECPRDAAPEAIRHTEEFAALCPDDAAFMCKRL